MIQRIAVRKTVAMCCESCGTIHENVPVQFDSKGAYAELEQEPCHHTGCTKRLCSACPRAACARCGLTECREHLVEYSGLLVCSECMAIEKEEAAAEVAEIALADQETATALAFASRAGMSLEQLRAAVSQAGS
jgi:hypothetical protein